MNDRGPWRAFEAAAFRGYWGVESEYPNLVADGDEILIPPSLTEQEARNKVEELSQVEHEREVLTNE